ncbi:MAG TPA: universal stress protein [Candidatus Dormibacteraeota bacterium]|nr:universal stress protein [Candidatus Dormibacteraeota bacterium]
MFGHILVPLDGSRLAEDILGPVRALALELGSRVTLLHVIEADAPARVHGEPHLTTIAEGEAYLERLVDELGAEGVQAEKHVHDRSVGDVAAAIDAHSHEVGADLTAMCKHGRAGLRQVFVGSIAQRILRGGGTPILLKRPERARGEPFQLRRILVPIDHEHDTRSAVDRAATLASAFQAEVRLMTAVPSLSRARGVSVVARLMPRATAASLEMEVETVSSQLEEQAARLAAAGVEASAAIRHEEPAEAILLEAESLPADLVVMSTHARTGFDAWYSGSTGTRVIAESSRPLLLLRDL